jgi:hypothetical protein
MSLALTRGDDMDDVADIAVNLIRLAKWVEADPKRIGKLSTGERIAAALLLDRKELLGDRTILSAIERLGPTWTEAVLLANRSLEDQRFW